MWLMGFNTSKCSVIHILPSMRKHFIDSSYTLHGHTLEAVGESKYFGVTISNNLTWTIHTENVTGKGNGTLGFLCRNLKDCTTQVKVTTYITTVYPTIGYKTAVWAPAFRMQGLHYSCEAATYITKVCPTIEYTTAV